VPVREGIRKHTSKFESVKYEKTGQNFGIPEWSRKGFE
jgi:hypothetical protein